MRERSTRQCPLPALSAARAPRPVLRLGRLLRRLARAGARRLHRAEQALRDPRLRTAVRRGGRGGVRSGGDHAEVSVGSPGGARRRRGPRAPDPDASRGPRTRAGAGRQRAGAPPSAMTARSRSRPMRGCSGSWPRHRARPSRRGPRSSARSTSRSRGSGSLGSLPLWALIAAAIKLEDGGPVFYGQERVGRGGRRFRSWKFRSMVVDADRRFGALQAREDDPRVTRTGRLLRATAMDELPQLWNILVGDMSFVGPRALRPEEIEVGGARHAGAARGDPGVRGAPSRHARPHRASRRSTPRGTSRAARSSGSTSSTSAGRASGSTSGSSRCRSGLPCEPSGSIEARRSDPRADSAVVPGFGSSERP